MTRREGNKVSEKRRGLGEDERQPVMARLAARWKRSNLVKLVTLRKRNNPGEAYVRRDRRKALHKTERDLDGPHEEAEIQRKTLRRRKNLVFSKGTCLQKKKVGSKVTPRKIGVGLKPRREPSRRRLGWRLDWWGSIEKKKASHFLGLIGRHQYSDQRSNRNRAPCVASTAMVTEGKEDQMARTSA